MKLIVIIFTDYYYNSPFENNPNVDCYFVCPNQCGRKYLRKKHLSRHLKYLCGVPKQFKCFLCDKEFGLKEKRRRHMIRMHKNESESML